jgi:hypothetical protein
MRISPAERIEKVKALLDSPYAGEREAAAEALHRLEQVKAEIPAIGTPAWFEIKRAHDAKIDFCFHHIGSANLSKADRRLIKNWRRYRGDPFSRGFEQLDRLYQQLKEEAGARLPG